MGDDILAPGVRAELEGNVSSEKAVRKRGSAQGAPDGKALEKPKSISGVDEHPEAAGTQNRNSRARQRTRKRLLDAAYRVMSRVGVDATTINQVTEEADLGFGSFYNYFTSKEEIARTVFREQMAEFSDHMDDMNAGIEDASVRLSRNTLRFLLKTRRDPVWGWFFVHAEFALQDVRTVLWKANQRNLKQGLQQGTYRFDTSPTTVSDIIFGSTFAVMRSILEGRASPTAEAETVELLMILMGVPPKRAKRLARQALPEE